MARRPAFVLSIVLAVVYAGLAIFFLLPGVYHPFSADSVNITHAYPPAAAVFLACAAVTLILGGAAQLGQRR